MWVVDVVGHIMIIIRMLSIKAIVIVGHRTKAFWERQRCWVKCCWLGFSVLRREAERSMNSRRKEWERARRPNRAFLTVRIGQLWSKGERREVCQSVSDCGHPSDCGKTRFLGAHFTIVSTIQPPFRFERNQDSFSIGISRIVHNTDWS